MEVIIYSNVTGLLGTTVISTDAEQTVSQLIRAFCSDRDIRHRSDLVLTNCRQEVLQKRRKLITYNVRNGEELYLSIKGMQCIFVNLLEQDGENIELADDYDKAQAFNDSFSTVFATELQNALPEVTITSHHHHMEKTDAGLVASESEK